MSKLLLVLCLLVATAYTAEASLLDSVKEKIEAVKETIAQIISSAVQTVQDAVDKAKQSAMDLAEKLKAKAQEISKKFYESVDEFLKKVDEKIAEITASADGVDVTQCTRMGSQIRQTAMEMVANASTCVVDKIDEGTDYIENINLIANEISQNLTEISKEAGECTEGIDGVQTGAKALYCINSAFLRATYTATKKVPAVLKNVAKLSWMVGTIFPSLSTCATTTSLATLYEDFTDVYQRMKYCAQEKIHEAHGTTPAL
ncbi:uncharacterized protein [Prorops nasuta]|uniref:uncharacterized protein n=1 Tax=Prorops nasuta TaxID=863751 RepID=UPI0034CDBF88